MATEDDETIEMDMPPEEARRLLESQDEKSEDLDEHSDNFPEPLKVRAKEIYDRLKKVYTGQVTLDDWYDGFAVSIKPEKDIEGWNGSLMSMKKEKRNLSCGLVKVFFKRCSKNLNKNGQQALLKEKRGNA